MTHPPSINVELMGGQEVFATVWNRDHTSATK